MNEQRFVVSDILWQRLEPYLPGKASDAGSTAKDNRMFLEAVFWRVRTGSPWRDQSHFTRAFTHIADCDMAMNPFISEDWQEIDASVLWATKEDDDRDEAPMRSPRVRRKS